MSFTLTGSEMMLAMVQSKLTWKNTVKKGCVMPSLYVVSVAHKSSSLYIYVKLVSFPSHACSKSVKDDEMCLDASSINDIKTKLHIFFATHKVWQLFKRGHMRVLQCKSKLHFFYTFWKFVLEKNIFCTQIDSLMSFLFLISYFFWRNPYSKILSFNPDKLLM